MPLDDSVWHVLRQWAATGADLGPARDAVADERHRAARLRMLDATADGLAACGALVAAMEDEVRARRHRLAEASPDERTERPPAQDPDPPARGRIDLSY